MSLRSALEFIGPRFRLVTTRSFARLGLRPDSFLVVVAVIVGLLTAAAAVSFHELINVIRNLLYNQLGEVRLYGPWMVMLVVWPALGGLLVGFISQYIFRAREGHGIVDVMESVIRSSGFVKPASALEKIITSAITIGTGGSTGAEGPIVQIGAAISSGVGSFFRLTRAQMPTIVACGAAAGISAIFNSPMGGMLFALEVILQDFSIRNVTPVVVASVIAKVATTAVFGRVFHESWRAIFEMPPGNFNVNWSLMGTFIVLGLTCGIVGASLSRFMHVVEEKFHHLKVPKVYKPAIGGAMLGLIAIVYVLFFGRILQHQAKPVPYGIYPLPAFFSDGYKFIQYLLSPTVYERGDIAFVSMLLLFLLVAKIVGTCLTVGSGGSGGVIAPALFVGSVTGGLIGVAFRGVHIFHNTVIQPEVYALVGMGAALSAVVHAPLASILILLELTNNTSSLVLPAMLATVVATGVSRLIMPDSIYTAALRQRGLRISAGSNEALMHRLSVEQVDMEPATPIHMADPVQRVLDLMSAGRASDFPVLNKDGLYCGMVLADDLRTILIEREAIPLLTVEEVVRNDIPFSKTSDDLAETSDRFARYETSHLAVCLPGTPGRVVGMVSRAALMRRYQTALRGET